MSMDLEKLGQLAEVLGKIDVDKLVELTKKMDLNKMIDTLNELAESMDSLTRMLRLLRKLDESGALAALEAVAEYTDETFNAMSRKEIMGMMGNMMMLMYLVSQLDTGMLMKLAEKMPQCTKKMQETFEKTEKGMGTFELLGVMKSPEFAGLLKGMQNMLKCMKEEKK